MSNKTSLFFSFSVLGLLMFNQGCFLKPDSSKENRVLIKEGEWRGVHMFAPWHNEMPMFKRAIAEVLAPLKMNVLILEVNYKFAFESHPELREPGNNLTKEDARELTDLCRKNQIRLIPQFNCLGHQSWAQTNFPLIVKYPELDETPNFPKNNKTIYCRSWCPLHPKTNEIVFALFEEIINAFQADAFHVGMDEVFLIGSEQCPRCRGKNTAELFAKAVNDYHQFLVEERKLEMLLWGDRLIDMKTINYGGDYESSANGTAPAIDKIPKDIIICDWHYDKHREYPSIPYFQEKGFRVLPSSWRNQDAALAMMDYAQKTKTEKMIGHLFTTWYPPQGICSALLGEGDLSKLPKEAMEAASTLKEGMRMLAKKKD
jgi:hypothetical protein